MSRRPHRRGAFCVLVLSAALGGCRADALPREALVSRVVDGDTVQLADGRLIRYLGIDTPEVRRRVGAGWVHDPQPYAEEATQFNRRLVQGKHVRLEYDIQTRDRFGRLLAYVYIGETLVNAELLRAGFAEPLIIAPNVKYEAEFRALAEHARRAGRGIWRGAQGVGR